MDVRPAVTVISSANIFLYSRFTFLFRGGGFESLCANGADGEQQACVLGGDAGNPTKGRQSARALKGKSALPELLWPLKQKMGHKETIASRRTKNVLFFLSSHAASLIIV